MRFVADWRLLLALCYDNCLRAYDTDTGSCKFVQMNENRCMFTSLEVDAKNGEVRAGAKAPAAVWQASSIGSGIFLCLMCFLITFAERVALGCHKQLLCLVIELW